MTAHQDEFFDELGLYFEDLWGRSLQLIDCQNLFCEISKYSRLAFPEIKGISGRSRIKQKYKQSYRPIPSPRYPEKWGINERIQAAGIPQQNYSNTNLNKPVLSFQPSLI